MLKRPKNTDTEDDLLRLQEEFLKAKSENSVKIEKRPVNSDNLSPPKKVRFKDANSKDVEQVMEDADDHITKFLSNVVEKDFSQDFVYQPPPVDKHPGGFPQAFKCHTQVKGVQKKQSLFAQAMRKRSAHQSAEKLAVSTAEVAQNFSLHTLSAVQPSVILTGEGLDESHSKDEVQKIHEENVAKLATMSVSEIEHYQRELRQSLDPSLVDFLTRKRHKEEGKDVRMLDSSDLAKPIEKITEISPHQKKIIEQMSTVVHGNVIEHEKLQWVQDLPEIVNGENKHYAARFDLQGDLLPLDFDTPTYLGLHHHGDEPERPGYSLNELFLLARSTFLQQRVLALNVLANIIRNAFNGKFSDLLSLPIVPTLLDAGLAFVLRWALDDTVDSVITAAVNAFHALLVRSQDLECLQTSLTWHRGLFVPWVKPAQDSDPGDDSEENSETDAEVLQTDVVKGLLNMSIVPRFRYILRNCRYGPGVVNQVLEVLTRIALHSSESAYKICQCRGLLDEIIESFVPVGWNMAEQHGDPQQNSYGHPNAAAIHFLVSMAQQGQSMAGHMISTYGNLMPAIVTYVCSDVELTKVHVSVQTMALCLWRVFISYGLAVKELLNVFEKFCWRMRIFLTTCSESPCNYNPLSLRLTGGMVMLIHNLVNTAVSVKQENMRQKGRPRTGSELLLSLPDIDWSQVEGLISLVVLMVELCLKNFTDECSEKNLHLHLEADAAVFNCMAALFAAATGGNCSNTPHVIRLGEKLCSSVQLFVQSGSFRKLVQMQSALSARVRQVRRLSGEITKSLPQLGGVLGAGAEINPIVNQNSPTNYLTSFFHMLNSMVKLYRPMADMFLYQLLQCTAVNDFVKVCVDTWPEPVTTRSYFIGFETLCLHELLVLISSRSKLAASLNSEFVLSYYKLAHQVVLNLLSGHDDLSTSFLTHVIFNRKLLDSAFANETFMQMHPSFSAQERSLLRHTVSTKMKMLTDTVDTAHIICNSYCDVLLPLMQDYGRCRMLTSDYSINAPRLCVGLAGHSLVPQDWFFLPLVKIYTQKIMSENATPKTYTPIEQQRAIDTINSSLQWLFLMEYINHPILDNMAPVLKLSRLACVFLADNLVYQADNLRMYLVSLLSLYCEPTVVKKTDFSAPVPGLPSFDTLYTQLLIEFSAASYGDSLFAMFILMPLQQKYPASFRMAFWGDNLDLPRAVTLKFRNLLLPVEDFLTPEEHDLEVLKLYCQELLSESILLSRNEVLYVIAVHHVNRFIYNQDGQHMELKKLIATQICKHHSEALKRDVISFKRYNVQNLHGLELYEQIPTHRRHLLEKFGCQLPTD